LQSFATKQQHPAKDVRGGFPLCAWRGSWDRLSRPAAEGPVPRRTYTIIVAPKGKGKKTAIRRAVQFFKQTVSGGGMSITPGLPSRERDFMFSAAEAVFWNLFAFFQCTPRRGYVFHVAAAEGLLVSSMVFGESIQE
jgi:hypothetical protein